MRYADKMQDAAQNFAKSVNPDFLKALDGGSGGGSSLPDITAEDEGKVLTVVEDSEHGTIHTIVAQQNATIVDSPVSISNYDFTGITEATTGVTMSINDDDYTCKILDNNGTLTIMADTDEPPFYWISSDGRFYAYQPKSGGDFGFDPVPGTYAISLAQNIPTLGAEWAEPSGGYEPYIIKVNLTGTTAGTLVNDFTEAKQAIADNRRIILQCFFGTTLMINQSIIQVFTDATSIDLRALLVNTPPSNGVVELVYRDAVILDDNTVVLSQTQMDVAYT